ncbi:hypothetical protein K505DRAFT_365976 [Melanomma pulvis-pyrius CBS 109.77]|uniref:Retrotransposon gag domain-containing protein n=1 Tax=Melanomma pulvis-pyrius CBS 109.77 TaxID=1314802 RepID=A0A6A6WY56_9PLEO|nr:hypothetical protein K505DRAFT_365976 [Melanomma pulvis-pyrius CBS 109.77]
MDGLYARGIQALQEQTVPPEAAIESLLTKKRKSDDFFARRRRAIEEETTHGATSQRPNPVLRTPSPSNGEPSQITGLLPTMISEETYEALRGLLRALFQIVLQVILPAKQQDGEVVSAYIARFERILHEAEAEDYPATVKISTFCYGLNSSTRRALNGQLTFPRSYPEQLRQLNQQHLIDRALHLTRRKTVLAAQLVDRRQLLLFLLVKLEFELPAVRIN